MKRPNGTGAVVKLSGKRRRPYAIRVMDGYKQNSEGQYIPKIKYIGYYEKLTDALSALEKYNTSPVELAKDTKQKKYTFAQIYDMWMEDISRRPKPLSKSTMDCYHAAFQNLSKLHNMVFERLTVDDIETIALKQSSKSDSTMKNIRIVLKSMYKTAMRKGIVKDDLSKLIILHSSNENKRPHKVFTDDEIHTLWANKNDFYAKLLLTLIYTGMRVNELLQMKSEKVCLADRYMVGGLKTKAGKDRIIPISDKIVPFLDTSHEYLITKDGKKLNYSYANDKLQEYMKDMKMEHYFHDTRHTTATLMERAEIPLLHRKLILGHESGDVTDRYTHVSIKQLIDDVNKI